MKASWEAGNKAQGGGGGKGERKRRTGLSFWERKEQKEAGEAERKETVKERVRGFAGHRRGRGNQRWVVCKEQRGGGGGWKHLVKCLSECDGIVRGGGGGTKVAWKEEQGKVRKGNKHRVGE